jgi:hypothetical protein
MSADRKSIERFLEIDVEERNSSVAMHGRINKHSPARNLSAENLPTVGLTISMIKRRF